jgi:hypothetical protein
MKALRITLFVIAFVLLVSQTFRHAYVRWLEPRASVLDKYDTETQKGITKAKSLDDLLRLYDDAFAKLRAEEEKTKAERAQNPNRERDNYGDTDAARNERQLKEAIKDWEDKGRQIHEVWHFWTAGFAALLLGFFVMAKVERWSGMSLFILAFAEMIWATCPSWRGLGSSPPEFDRLLLHKFSLSIIGIVLLLASSKWIRRFEERIEPM